MSTHGTDGSFHNVRGLFYISELSYVNSHAPHTGRIVVSIAAPDRHCALLHGSDGLGGERGSGVGRAGAG